MSRPKSEEKRTLLLEAATEVVAKRGDGAPTSLISQRAGVAEGTLFTYFPTKDALLNALFERLLADLYASTAGMPKSGRRAKLQHAWTRTLAWGMAHPQKRAALRALQVSSHVAEGRRAEAARSARRFLAKSIGIADEPPGFGMAALEALAEATLNLMTQNRDRAEAYSAAGFEACWKILTLR